MSKATQHHSKARRKVLLGVLASVFSLVLVACDHGQDESAKSNADVAKLGPYGPPIGIRAHVVRSVQVINLRGNSRDFHGIEGGRRDRLDGLVQPQ